jgi:hypothetical protein
MAMTYMQGTPDTMLQEELHKLQVLKFLLLKNVLGIIY